MGKEWDPDTLFDVFGSERAREILVLADMEPMSARDLAEYTDSSLPTVYRRLDALTDHDLLAEETNIDADGNHFKTYETRLDAVTYTIEDGGFTVDVSVRQDLVDRFESFWSDLEGGEGDGGDPGDGDRPADRTDIDRPEHPTDIDRPEHPTDTDRPEDSR